MRRFGKGLVALLAALPLPAAAQDGPPLGLCAPGRMKATVEWQAIDASEEARDWNAVVALRRTHVNENCDNGYRWLELAYAYGRAGRPAEALAIADYVSARFSRLWTFNLDQQDRILALLRELPGFAESKFGRKFLALEATRAKLADDARRRIAAASASAKPAEHYVVKGVCPFECCTYREWNVEEKVELYDGPAGAPLGIQLQPGEWVRGLTGEVHLKPKPMVVGAAFDAKSANDSGDRFPIPVGAIVWELDYMGESFRHFWRRGRIFEKGLFIDPGQSCVEFDPEECWAEYLDPPGTEEVHDWWAKIRRKDGTKAWARSDGFGNMDSCG